MKGRILRRAKNFGKTHRRVPAPGRLQSRKQMQQQRKGRMLVFFKKKIKMIKRKKEMRTIFLQDIGEGVILMCFGFTTGLTHCAQILLKRSPWLSFPSLCRSDESMAYEKTPQENPQRPPQSGLHRGLAPRTGGLHHCPGRTEGLPPPHRTQQEGTKFPERALLPPLSCNPFSATPFVARSYWISAGLGPSPHCFF